MAARASSWAVTGWHNQGRRVRCTDGEVFVRTEGELGARAPLLLLHGFPTSSHDYAAAWARLSRATPLITLDFMGFGASAKPEGFGYTLGEQADVVLEVLRQLGVRAVHLLGHDMGTSVATELFARRQRGLLPIAIESATLMNGSVFLEMANLQPAQKLLRNPLVGGVFARASAFPVFRRSMRRLFAEPDAISDDELRTAWQLLERDHGLERLPKIVGYLDERERLRARWVGALEALDVPSLIVWGAKDPVSVLPIGERLARTIKGAKLRVLPDLGHYPQLEGPDVFAAEVGGFLAEISAK